MLIGDRVRLKQKECRTKLVDCIPKALATVKNESWKNSVICLSVVKGKGQSLGSDVLETAFKIMKDT